MARYFHHPVLGTNLVIGIEFIGVEPPAGDELFGGFDEPSIEGLADRIDGVITAEIDRLEAMFTIFDPSSELERWKRGEVDQPSADFVALLNETAYWVAASGGAFHPLAAELSTCWKSAEADGRPPAPAAIAAIVDRLAAPGFEIVDGIPVRTGDVSGFQLHAFGKGWIVDRGIERAMEYLHGVCGEAAASRVDIVVNAGGDLAHRGPTSKRIAIEHPLRRYDNEPPIDRVAIGDAGLATSGRARQGFEIGGRWYSHVIDPRTGYPVDQHASISVIAESAATADVVATIAGVEPVDVALDTATMFDVACMVVTNDGELHANDAWAGLQNAD